jgi:hypothetical protein
VQEIFDAIGFNVKLVIAGFAGSVVKVLYDKSISPWDVLGSVIGGTFCANYLGAAAVKVTNLPDLPTGFIMGLLGMWTVQFALSKAKAYGASRDAEK